MEVLKMKKLSDVWLRDRGCWELRFRCFAHHSFQAEYDESKPLTLVGKVTKVLTDNPHGWIYLDAKNAKGKW